MTRRRLGVMTTAAAAVTGLQTMATMSKISARAPLSSPSLRRAAPPRRTPLRALAQADVRGAAQQRAQQVVDVDLEEADCPPDEHEEGERRRRPSRRPAHAGWRSTLGVVAQRLVTHLLYIWHSGEARVEHGERVTGEKRLSLARESARARARARRAARNELADRQRAGAPRSPPVWPPRQRRPPPEQRKARCSSKMPYFMRVRELLEPLDEGRRTTPRRSTMTASRFT